MPTPALLDEAVELFGQGHPKTKTDACPNCRAMGHAIIDSSATFQLLTENCALLSKMLKHCAQRQLDPTQIRNEIAKYVAVVMKESLQIGALAARLEPKPEPLIIPE